MAYQSEIEKLEQRYRENPQQWFAALADSYRKAGDLELALEVVRVGLEKRPNYVSGHIVKGRCLIDQKKDADASAAFQRVLELDAENVIALKALSEISERAGQLDDARRWLTRLLEVDPMNEEAQQALAKLPGPLAVSAAASAPSAAPVPAAGEEGGEGGTLAGLEPTAVGESTVAESPAAEDFSIERSEEAPLGEPAAVLEPIQLESSVAGADDLEPSSAGRSAISEMETLHLEAPAAEPEGAAAGAEQELEPVSFEPPGSATADESMLSLEPEPADTQAAPPVAEAPEPVAEAPEEATVASSGELPLIFPEDVAAEGEPEGAPEPEPVVTETMAELYANQGLLGEARDIYRQLVAQRPGDPALARRLAELETAAAGPPARRSGSQPITAGGPTVRDFLSDVFTGRPAAPPAPAPMESSAPVAPEPADHAPSPLEAAFDEPEEPGEEIRGAPTRRASDDLSLASVFGEEPPPVNTRPSAETTTPEGGKKFSFDEFFGGAPPKTPPTTRAAAADREKEPGADEDEFKRWLKGLKS